MSSRGDGVVNMRSEVKPSHKILMTKLLASGRHSDFTIVCGDRRFPVHKSIMCERSEVVAAAVAHSFREAADKVINLPQFAPEAVHGALYYAYTLVYPTDLKKAIEAEFKDHSEVTPEYWARVGKHYWTYDLEILKVADYLGLGALAKDAKAKLDERCKAPTSDLFLSKIAGYVSLVEQLYCKSSAEEKGYEDAEIYVELLRDSRELLLKSTSKLVAEHIKKEELNRLTEKIAEFKQDVFKKLAEQQQRTSRTIVDYRSWDEEIA